jgi:hypothetical protein
VTFYPCSIFADSREMAPAKQKKKRHMLNVRYSLSLNEGATFAFKTKGGPQSIINICRQRSNPKESNKYFRGVCTDKKCQPEKCKVGIRLTL